ncbi:MAG TPA: V-type ATP synthase subunit I [Oscillospiraceae bacterium]|nr:V-type ATP synthase subunit I [Oscillospiraceae bacterium]HPS35559.1 V-type ATP synthase subunit I [Oscillospiraceae bacterium]
MIVEMKKVSILGLLNEQDEILEKLQRLGKIQFIGETRDAEKMKRVEIHMSNRTEIDFCIDFLSKYRVVTRSLLASLDVVARPVDEKTAAVLAKDEKQLEKAVAKVREYESRLCEINGERERAESMIAALFPWLPVKMPLSEIRDTDSALVAAGSVLQRDSAGFAAEIDRLDGIVFEEVYADAENTYYIIAAHKSSVSAWDETAKRFNWAKVDFSEFTDTAEAETERLKKEIVELERDKESIEAEAGSSDLLDYFENMSDLTAIKGGLLDAKALSEDTMRCFAADGWVPVESAETLKKAIAEVTDNVVVEFSEVTEEDEPPVLVRNNKIIRPFESVTDSFSHPNYRDVDPNGLVAVFYSLFFGLILGDAGYGIILSLACGAVLLFLHPKPGMRKNMGVFLAGGLGAILSGVIFGSWFGTSVIPPLLPVTSSTGMPIQLEIPLQTMVFTIGIGIVHMFSGYIALALKNIKQGKVFAAIFDQGFWMLLIVGILMLAGPMAIPGDTGALIGTIGKWTAIGSAVVLVLTQGRSSKGLFGKLGGGLGSLYNIFGFVGDALSYTRLFALSLSSGIIAWVFNMMSGLVGTSVFGIIFMVIVLLIGHALNFSLSLLSAYVHTSRLQYVEFFGKFFGGNGDEFVPLARNTQYIEIK